MPEVQPANWLIVELFIKVYKYWHRTGMDATPLHLNPQWIETRASKLPWYRQISEAAMERVWDGLDVMESECLAVFKAQRDS